MALVIFESHRETEEGTPLLELLEDAPFKIKTPCKKGKCGKCKCRAFGDVNPPTANERKFFSENDLASGYRLACEVVVEGEVHVMKAEKRKK